MDAEKTHEEIFPSPVSLRSRMGLCYLHPPQALPHCQRRLFCPAGCVPSGAGSALLLRDLATVLGGGSLSQPDPWDTQSMGLSYPQQSQPRTCLEITSGTGQVENPINLLAAVWFVCMLHLNKHSSRASLSKLQLGCRSGTTALKACQESCFLTPEAMIVR